MDDVIYKQAAIDEVQRHRENVLGGYEYDEGVASVYAAAHNHIIEVIKCIPSAQQWIPCSERLPEEFKRVLCCTDMREMFLARVYIFDDGNYSFDDEDGMMWEGNVVAWMPLPEPYKGENDG